MSYDSSDRQQPPEYVSPHGFVALSGLSLAIVRHYVANGRLPSVQPGGRRCRVLIPVSALELLAVGKTAGRAAATGSLASKAQPVRAKGLPGRRPKWRSLTSIHLDHAQETQI